MLLANSLTDTGNTIRAAHSLFSSAIPHGSLWIEYLSTQLGLAYNPANNPPKAAAKPPMRWLRSGKIHSAPANASSSLSWCGPGGNDFIHNFSKGVTTFFWNNVICTIRRKSVERGQRSVCGRRAPDCGAEPGGLEPHSARGGLGAAISSAAPDIYARQTGNSSTVRSEQRWLLSPMPTSDLELINPNVYARFKRPACQSNQ